MEGVSSISLDSLKLHTEYDVIFFFSCSDDISRGVVSSFAYQGTNSHAVAISGTRLPPNPTPHSWNWRKGRMWYQVTYHPLLMHFSSSGRFEAVMESNIRRAAMHFLHDNAVQGTPIFPSGLLMETASAAGMAFLGQNMQDNNNYSSTDLLVEDAVFETPLYLDEGKGKRVLCYLDPVRGTVRMNSASPAAAAAGAQVTHMSADLKFVQRMSEPRNGQLYGHEEYSFFHKGVRPPLSAALFSQWHRGILRSCSVDSAFASIQVHNLHHSGYFVHPSIAESAQQLAVMLKASHAPSPAALVCTAVAAFGPIASAPASSMFTAVGTMSGEGTSTADTLIEEDGVNVPTLSFYGTHLASLKSWTTARPLPKAVDGVDLRLGLTTASGLGGNILAPDVVSQLSRIIADVLGANVAPDQPLMAAGLDSIGAVELKNAISDAFGQELPSTVSFDYPTIQALAGYLVQNGEANNSAGSSSQYKDLAVTTESTSRALLELVSTLIGADVVRDQPLMEAGLDSIGAVELRNAVHDSFGVDLPATVTFDYPSVDALASFITAGSKTNNTIGGNSSSLFQPPSFLRLADHPKSGGRVTAVTGWAGVAAGAGSETHSIASRFFNAENLIRPVPLERWDVESVHASADILGSGALRMAAWVPDIEFFDNGIFRLSKTEALGMDPQARILLEQTWNGLNNAKIMDTPDVWSSTGVYIGSVWTEYNVLQEHLDLSPSTATLTGSGLNFSVGRVSYTFGLQGPCIGMDTACSSSLVAIHLGHQGLHDGETAAALAGGTNFMLVPTTSVHLAQLGSLSSNGRSKTLDASADGYGRGEGCIVLVLQHAGVDSGGFPPAAFLHGKYKHRLFCSDAYDSAKSNFN